MEVIDTYNGGVPFRNIPGATEREINILGLYPDVKEDVKKARASARGKYLVVAFLLSLDWRRYRYLIVALKSDYVKQHKNYFNTVTEIHGRMVAFKTTRVAPVSGGFNGGLNLGNVATKKEEGGASGADSGRKQE